MVRIVTMTFPMTSMDETIERFKGLPAPPDFITLRGPWVSGKAEEKIKTATLFEFDKSKQDQASDYLKERYNSFLGVPDISIEIEEWVEVEEALETLGA
jgi:hypothetical protein